MEDRIKLIKLAPGIQAVCIKDRMRVKRVKPRKGYEEKPVIGCIIYIDCIVGGSYVELANRFVCDSLQDMDEKFDSLTVGQLIPMYNHAVKKGNFGLPVLALETESGRVVPMAVTDKDKKDERESDKK